MNILEIKKYLRDCMVKDMPFNLDNFDKQIVLYNYFNDTKAEIERLNNIINDLEEWLKIKYNKGLLVKIDEVVLEIKGLKGVDK